MADFQAEQWIAADLSTVFSFFSDPQNFPRIMPPEIRARLESMSPMARVGAVEQSGPVSGGTAWVGGSGQVADSSGRVAGAGSTITFSFRPIPFLPVRKNWVVRIVEYVPERLFRDVQQKGPMKSWEHRHEFREEVRGGVLGTLIRDQITFEIGFGMIGKLAEPLVERCMRRTFAHRQRVVESLLGGKPSNAA